jgi:hypothetical protein
MHMYACLYIGVVVCRVLPLSRSLSISLSLSLSLALSLSLSLSFSLSLYLSIYLDLSPSLSLFLSPTISPISFSLFELSTEQRYHVQGIRAISQLVEHLIADWCLNRRTPSCIAVRTPDRFMKKIIG